MLACGGVYEGRCRRDLGSERQGALVDQQYRHSILIQVFAQASFSTNPPGRTGVKNDVSDK